MSMHLDPVARLEAAVRVDPQAVRVASQHARVDELLDLGAQRIHRRHRRRVHVVHARACNTLLNISTNNSQYFNMSDFQCFRFVLTYF